MFICGYERRVSFNHGTHGQHGIISALLSVYSVCSVVYFFDLVSNKSGEEFEDLCLDFCFVDDCLLRDLFIKQRLDG